MYLLERSIVPDLALAHARCADVAGNLAYRLTVRNFNPLVAAAGKVTVVDAEIVLDDGFLDADQVVTPGVFVHRIVPSSARVKDIEQRTVRPRVA